jgi:hypothetical protein
MTKFKIFKRKQIDIKAIHWFNNGDQPEDECVIVYPVYVSTTKFEPFLSEGRVVKHNPRPIDDSLSMRPELICEKCGKRYYSDHGLLETLSGKVVICPGDWIITGVNGEYYPCKHKIFKKLYEEII